MKRRIVSEKEWNFAPGGAFYLASALSCVTRARMGEEREDIRERRAAAKLWLQIARWQRDRWGWPVQRFIRSQVWTGETFRFPVLP